MQNKINKKGQLSDLITDPLSLVIIAFLILVLYIVSMAAMASVENGVKETASKVSLDDQGHYSLQAFLQKNIDVNVNGRTQAMSIAEIIRLSQIDLEYKGILDSEKFEGYKLDIFSRHPMFYIPSNQTINVAATKTS